MAVKVPAGVRDDQRLNWLRAQLDHLQEAATTARSLVKRAKRNAEQARQVLVDAEAELARLEADIQLREQRVAEFQKEHPGV